MKKWFLALFAATVLMSCGADQATVDNMTGEMCEALDGVDMDDPVQLMDAATKMMAVAEKTEEYSGVTEAQLQSAMEEQCPDGWANFEKLKAMGGE